MRLGADVIVFSRCSGKDGKRFLSVHICLLLFLSHCFSCLVSNGYFLQLMWKDGWIYEFVVACKVEK